MTAPLASHDFTPGDLESALEFLKRTRSELRELRKVHVHKDRVDIFDINGDRFEVRGLGYPDADIVAVLNAVNTNFNPRTVHEPTDLDFKEFLTGRRRAWAEDRVM